ncbi:S-adenosylmethionine:tRNA ribosyltransferase-isomerase [Maribellus mangrovi]|uniref:S-adenosylmethionine:tRNA ribosyltransferase-isomerase n=1 Tax=Maribellus mangrovi TaxID=3133146 RepID=UPI0030ED0C64
MNSERNIKISDFTYELPDERIAKYPLPQRDKSKLLTWQNRAIAEDIFENCTGYLPENAQLVFNNTRVIHARLFFRKETGAKIEIFCLEPVEPGDYQIAFQQTEEVTWKCMVGNSKKWKEGLLSHKFEFEGKSIEMTAAKIAQEGNSFHIRFVWNRGLHFSEIIEHIGQLPIPPYLNRETEESDEETYQTVYAKIDGSVAAPTAGLHFTDAVLGKLKTKNIATREITLHVGAGTFQPVKSETIDGHTMHHEQVEISIDILRSFLEDPENIIAVGTTSVRSIESLYWIGLQLEEKRFDPFHPEVKQWEPYENTAGISIEKALQNIIYFLAENGEKAIRFSTQIIILPGYDFKLIRGMFTNFHQPQSTLLLLISAFLGQDWKRVYDFALANGFRFLSYGDSNLYLK